MTYKSFHLSDRISRYEEGRADEDEIRELFQYLIDTGLAWELQGSYGREASRLIEAGVCTP